MNCMVILRKMKFRKKHKICRKTAHQDAVLVDSVFDKRADLDKPHVPFNSSREVS